MRVLLDTCAVLWATLSPASLSRAAAAVITDERNEIAVSAASAWEIATKVRMGRLPGAERLEREFVQAMEDAGYVLMPIDTASALRAGRLLSEHKDPFDRMIAAQALSGDIPVVSLDARLDGFGIRRIW